MKKIITIVVFILVLNLGFKHTEVKQQSNPYVPVLYYDKNTNTFYAKGYDEFTYGLDSTLHKIKIKKGINTYYFVFYNKSIELKITEYDE